MPDKKDEELINRAKFYQFIEDFSKKYGLITILDTAECSYFVIFDHIFAFAFNLNGKIVVSYYYERYKERGALNGNHIKAELEADFLLKCGLEELNRIMYNEYIKCMREERLNKIKGLNDVIK